MNTPPPSLQPIVDEAKNGLFHYFGQQNQQQQQQQLLLGKTTPAQTGTHNYQQMSSQFLHMDLISGQQLNSNNNSELKLMPNLTQIGPNLQNSLSQQINKQEQSLSGSFLSPFMHQLNPQDTDLNFSDNHSSLDGSEHMTEDDDRASQASIQEKGQSEWASNRGC